MIGEETTPAGPQTRAQFVAKLNYFREEFGAENGAKWCGEGKTYAEAVKLHCDVLQAEIDKTRAETEEIENRIAQIAIDGFEQW